MACSIATKPVDERQVQPKAVDATVIVDVQDKSMVALIIVNETFILRIGFLSTTLDSLFLRRGRTFATAFPPVDLNYLSRL